jgi:CheY-like chemotaxis protein
MERPCTTLMGAESGPGPLAAVPARREPRLAGLRVLSVDDAPLNLLIVQRLLEHEGAICVTAGDGLQALQRLQADPVGFDVVLMDVQMPALDGIEATRRLRAEPALARLPVIAVTAGALLSQREAALQAGMNDFLAKPFDLEALVALLLRWAPGTGPADAGGTTAPAAAGFPAVAGIDHLQAFARLQGDRGLFLGMLRALREEFGDVLRPLRAEVAQGDLVGAARRLHKLRGVAGNLSANRVAQRAQALESALRAGCLEGVEALLGELAAALETVWAGLPAEVDAAAQAGAARDEAGAPPAAVPPPDAGDIARLQAALAGRRAAALSLFEALQPALAAHHGAQAVAPLARAVEELRFEAAGALLRAWYPGE